MTKEIPFSPPDIREEDIDAVVSVLKSGWITTGPVGKKFEDAVAKLSDAPGCVTVSSATTGLEAVFRLLGVGPGDEVIVPAYTYTASASAAAHEGATIVLVDSEPDCYTPSVEQILQKVTPATKAIVTVDIGGVPFERGDLVKALEADTRFEANSKLQEAIGRVAVIDDAAHSLGATIGGRGLANDSDFAVYSFHAVKNLTTAEGGAIVWNKALPVDTDLVYRTLRTGILHGQSKDALSKMRAGAWEYDIEYLGYKANMPDILAALGLSQMGRYQSVMERRGEIVKRYDQELSKHGIQSLTHFSDAKTSSFHLYLSRLPQELAPYRNQIIENMAQAGIATNVHYKPLPMMTAYRDLGFDIADFPNARAVYERTISLPLHMLLTDDDVDRVIREYVQQVEQIREAAAR